MLQEMEKLRVKNVRLEHWKGKIVPGKHETEDTTNKIAAWKGEEETPEPRSRSGPAEEETVAMPGGEGDVLVTGKGRILIMDDEAIIRDSAGRILMAAGYDVECAGEGDETVELYRKAAEEGKPFDVVILDLTVPGGAGGKETVQRLLSIDQAVKTIISSGYSQDPIMTNYRDFGFTGAIAKPYRMRELCEAVAKIIDGIQREIPPRNRN